MSYHNLAGLLAGSPPKRKHSNLFETFAGLVPRENLPNNLAALLYGVEPALSVPAKPQKTQEWIKFKDFWFSGPFPFATAPKHSWSGIYAVCAYDATWGPRPYRIIYFGESGNMAERVTPSHENFPAWVRAAGTRFNLYVAFHNVTRLERMTVEKRLIEHYNPACNQVHNAFRGLLARHLSSLK